MDPISSTCTVRVSLCCKWRLRPCGTDNGLIAFNKMLGERFQWDLAAWRRSVEKKGGKESLQWAEGFQTLDALGGGGWSLACQLVTPRAGRPTFGGGCAGASMVRPVVPGRA